MIQCRGFEVMVSKTAALETWRSDDGVTAALCILNATPNAATVDKRIGLLERFVVLLYDRTISHEHVI